MDHALHSEKNSSLNLKGELWKFGLALTFFKNVFKNSICYIFLLLFFWEFFSQAENGPEFRSQKQPALPNLTIVLCCIAAWIQPDISGCQQNFLVVWRWNQLRTFLGYIRKQFCRFSRGCKTKCLKLFKKIH